MGGNCAGYCNGQEQMGADGQHQIRQSFNKQDMQNQHNDFESKYGGSSKYSHWETNLYHRWLLARRVQKGKKSWQGIP